MNIKISSNSWGGGYPNEAFGKIIKKNNKKHLFVAAAGNSGRSHDKHPSYPCDYPYVLCVASTDRDDDYSWFTDYGKKVDIAAPGSDVYSTVLNNGYSSKSGTSMATPHVAGLAGLLYSYRSDLFETDMQKLSEVILSTGDRVTGRKTRTGKRINALKALQKIGGAPSPEPTPAPEPVDKAVKKLYKAYKGHKTWKQQVIRDWLFRSSGPIVCSLNKTRNACNAVENSQCYWVQKKRRCNQRLWGFKQNYNKLNESQKAAFRALVDDREPETSTTTTTTTTTTSKTTPKPFDQAVLTLHEWFGRLPSWDQKIIRDYLFRTEHPFRCLPFRKENTCKEQDQCYWSRTRKSCNQKMWDFKQSYQKLTKSQKADFRSIVDDRTLLV
jgi:hypothetical protein